MEEQLDRSPAPIGDAAYGFMGILRELESTGYPMVEQPARMALPLYPIQRQTLSWALAQERAHRGGLLGDDMGFGKTLIAAALVSTDDRRLLGPTLVVAPTKSLLDQWRRELTKAQPDGAVLSVYVHTEHWDTDAAARADVSLTTIEIFKVSRASPPRLRRDFGKLKQQSWGRLIVDESSQHLRTLSSNTSANLGQLRATHRWILSGTAVDGKLTALAGQLAFLGVTGSAARREWWAQVQADLKVGVHQRVRDAARRRAVDALSRVMMRHSHAQTFTHSREPLIPGLTRKDAVFVAVPFERALDNLVGHTEVVYRALEHLARLELKAGQGYAHSLFGDLPAGRVQELLLASTHAQTVEAGEVAARMPKLQTCKVDALMGEKQVPTRLVTLALVITGVSSSAQHDAVINGSRCVMPECNALFGPPGASSPSARVIANGCCHSYCKRCISKLLLDHGAAYQQVVCRHPGCQNRVQLGSLREIVSDAEYDAAERNLDDNADWQALDKSRPPARALEKLRVSICDSYCCDPKALKVGKNSLLRAGCGRCADNASEARVLSTQFVPRLAKADMILPGSLDAIDTREQFNHRGSVDCVICLTAFHRASDLAAMPCGHSAFCQPCLEGAYDHSPRCPICRRTAEPLHFCKDSCAQTAFSLRLESIESDVDAGRVCDGCPKVLPPCQAFTSGKRKGRKGQVPLIYRCHWPKRTSTGAAHMASVRFHSKLCAEQWFKEKLQPLDESFEGNRLLYQPGENQRVNFDELTPLTRRVGDVWYRLGYEHAETEKGSLKRNTEEWVDLLINFPGMQPHAFSAHLDAAGGSWTNPAQIPLAPKIARLCQLIGTQSDDEKFLIFSQSKMLLELVATALMGNNAAGGGDDGNEAGGFARRVELLNVGERIIIRDSSAKNRDLPCGARGTVQHPCFPVHLTDPDTGEEWEEDRVTVRFDDTQADLELRIEEVVPVPFVTWAKNGPHALSIFHDEPMCCGLLLESGHFAAGLTLTSASTIFVLEPQLDASLQAQLEARIHRPGQTRDVKIVHLYTPGTIEERVVRRMPEFTAERDRVAET